MERFRQSHRYAEANGFVSGYPDFEQSMEATIGIQYGTVLLGQGDVETRVVLATELGYAGEDVGERALTLPRFNGQLTYILESAPYALSSKSTGLRNPSVECRRLGL